ncbi:MAG: TetR/AcrR family transcriptional regulator [Actinobacteria bacterium]|nr:MAG: TetR/AcrR family transcriptional regulator [Actinomycetota bacterium]TML83377.1 MAG: TetR/AcrR family transcriptional regulator [Actinomycetota bacterium]
MPRLTRKEKQAHTRECLMQSAARVFTRRGLQQASIDEVAEDAGFTKGAFYANFKSKEELFLAMLDERFSERIEEIERVIAGEGTTAEKAQRAGDDFTQMIVADREWQRLFFEFSAYAARNDEFREELVTRYRSMRDRIAAALRARAEAAGFESALPYDQIALMTCAMANGVALEKLLEGEEVPDDLYGTMLTLLFAGLDTLKRSPEVAAAST